MAKTVGLSCLQKRDLLNLPAASTKSLLEWGDRLERQGLLHDALSFFEKAGARDAIIRIRDASERDGDLFLYRRSSKALGEEPTSENWIALGRRAAELGKTAFAVEAFRHAGREDLISQTASPPTDAS